MLKAVDRYNKEESTNRSAIDLGGIVGGWIRDLARKRPRKFQTLALADSSMRVDDGQGTLAAWYGEIPYRFDGFSDVRLFGRGFLARRHRTFSRRLGGDYRSKSRLKKRVASIPTPAFPAFWSYNDKVVKCLRRYKRDDLWNMSSKVGLQLIDSR